MKHLVIACIACLTLVLPAVFSEQGEDLVKFEKTEDSIRFQSLLKELRCLVCQNQSLAGSSAGLAKDLRDQVEQGVRRGDSNQQIIDFMVERYGDFILYDPPLKKSTVLLWFAPYIFIGLAGVGLVWFVLQRNEKQADAKIDQARRKRAAALLAAKQNNDKDNS